MAGQQTPMQLAGGLIPGVPFVNWLNHIGENPNGGGNTPQVQAEQTQRMMRARIGYRIQQQRAAAGLAPHNDNDLNAAIDAEIAQFNRPPPQAQPQMNALRARQ